MSTASDRAPGGQQAFPVGLWAQFRRHLPRYGAGLLLLGAYQYSQYWFDTRLMRAINAATGGDYDLALHIGSLLVGVAILAFGIRVLSRMAIFNAGRIAEYELRSALLSQLQRLGPSFYRRMSTGDIMSRITNDLVQVRLLLGFGVLNSINTLFALISAFSVTLAISVPLTLASLSILPPLLLVTRSFSKRFYTTTRDNQQALGQLSDRVQSSIAGIRVVKAFALEDSELERFEKSNQAYLERSLELARLRGSLGPIMQVISAGGILIVFWYGGHLMLSGQLSTGGFLAFFRALSRLTWPLMAMGFLLGLLQRGRASYSRLAEIFDAEPEVKSGDLRLERPLVGALSVRQLSFTHGERRVLDDVSFELPQGGSLAIVGRTGSGKSTLARLLPRLVEVPPGSIFLDGHDIRDLPLDALRSTIGYAQQTPFLFSTTAARNIAFPLDEPDSAEADRAIVVAAQEASIDEEVRLLPDGYDTVVGERGVQLSGGQKQRIALARAFIAEPKILVLDDPLSAVDARTEQAILQAIDRQRERRGLILITHRVAAAARCDAIIVLDQGRVVERGTHAELCAGDGIYAQFAEEQRIESELERLGRAASEEPAA